jgi:putative membrane protein
MNQTQPTTRTAGSASPDARSNAPLNDRVYLPVIGALSVVIPIVVALLLYLPGKSDVQLGFDVKFFPFLNACINTTVTVLLLAGYVFISRGQRKWHQYSMMSALVLSTLFLVSYVVYHYLDTEQTKFGGQGFIRYVYFFILISHIVLATTVVPLALLSVYRAINKQYEAHRRIVRYTFPIWLYVSVTGVLVYVLISPYYPQP